MENYYEQKLNILLRQYGMEYQDTVDSSCINALIVRMFQEHCSNKKVALWGAGRNNSKTSHASVILTRYISQLQGMVCLIDSAVDMQGKEMLGFPVIAPQEVQDKGIDVIIVASRASAESIKQSIAEYAPDCEVLDIYQELREQGVCLQYNFYEEKSEYVLLYELRREYETQERETEKQESLRQLIALYLKIRDFYYAFYFIDKYVVQGYDTDGSMTRLRQSIGAVLEELRKANRKRKEDITVYFVDSVRAIDVLGDGSQSMQFHFLDDFFGQSLFFSNVYSTGPTTYESLTGLLAERYSYGEDVYADNFLFEVEEVPLLRRAWECGMDIWFYISEEYKIMKEDDRVCFDNHIHMTEKLWHLACNKAVSEKPVLSFAYVVWELHFPFLCGFLHEKPEINGFYEVGLKDMSGYIEQQFQDCFSYTEKEFMFYESLIQEKGYSVFFSDHSQVVYDKKHFWPFYKYYNDPDRQTHCVLAVKGPGVVPGICDCYVSMIHFNEILASCIFQDGTLPDGDEIVPYQYYNIHHPELRCLAEKNGDTDYINGMQCFASRKYVYMINIFGKEELYCRDNLEDNMISTEEGQMFVREVHQKFDLAFPEFLLERAGKQV